MLDTSKRCNTKAIDVISCSFVQIHEAFCQQYVSCLRINETRKGCFSIAIVQSAPFEQEMAGAGQVLTPGSMTKQARAI